MYMVKYLIYSPVFIWIKKESLHERFLNLELFFELINLKLTYVDSSRPHLFKCAFFK